MSNYTTLAGLVTGVYHVRTVDGREYVWEGDLADDLQQFSIGGLLVCKGDAIVSLAHVVALVPFG